MRKRGGQSWWPWEPGIRQLPIFGSSTSLLLMIWPINYLVERGETWINILSFVFSIVVINGRGRQRSFLRKRWISCPFKTHLHPRGRFLFLHWSKFLSFAQSGPFCGVHILPHRMWNNLALWKHLPQKKKFSFRGEVMPERRHSFLKEVFPNYKHCLKAKNNSFASATYFQMPFLLSTFTPAIIIVSSFFSSAKW